MYMNRGLLLIKSAIPSTSKWSVIASIQSSLRLLIMFFNTFEASYRCDFHTKRFWTPNPCIESFSGKIYTHLGMFQTQEDRRPNRLCDMFPKSRTCFVLQDSLEIHLWTTEIIVLLKIWMKLFFYKVNTFCLMILNVTLTKLFRHISISIHFRTMKNFY